MAFPDPSTRQTGEAAQKSAPIIRSAILFVNFFLIITALYQLKPSSRSLILDVWPAERLPYVWILSAAVLFAAVSGYQWLLRRLSRLYVVLGTAALFMALLALFRLALYRPGPLAPVAFYVFVDLVGVVLVEQFWSLANSVYSTRDGKSWYGLIGTGGLLGGGLGSALAAALIHYTPLQTPDLLLVAAGILGLIFALTALMGWRHIYTEDPDAPASVLHQDGRWRWHWHGLPANRYLLLIAGALLMAQLVSPMVEFQFMKIVAVAYPEREARTATLGLFFSVLSGFSIVVNLLVTPLVLRWLGVLAGLLIQPLLLGMATSGFALQPGFATAAVMKIADRGLSYSITRAARELLYIPVDTLVMYQAKAWIDMFGYRTFKMVGALLILLLTQWTGLAPRYLPLNWVILLLCAVWGGLLVVLYRDYQALAAEAG